MNFSGQSLVLFSTHKKNVNKVYNQRTKIHNFSNESSRI